MKEFLFALLFAVVLVTVPPVLDTLGVGGTYVVTPLIPGLAVAGLLERANVIRAMDESGDLTTIAAISKYGGSFLVWLAVSWLSASVVSRRFGAASAN